jgi:SAM-dependent methyltransferase
VNPRETPPPVHFPEDAYGSVKRVLVFRGWMAELRATRGRPLSVLDFGCGTGRGVSVPLAEAGDVVHGVDTHREAIARARAAHAAPNLTFSDESAEDLRRRGARFDVIVCSEVLEHLDDPGRCLRDLRALVAEDGRLLVTVPNGIGAYETLMRVRRALDRVGVGRAVDGVLAAARRLRGGRAPADAPPAAEAPFLEHGGHVQFFRLPRLRRLFAEAGWRIVESRGRTLVCGPYADFWIARLRLHRLNNALADHLPLALAADWMFCARPAGAAD